MQHYVTYVWVGRDEPKKSGLELAAQDQDIALFLAAFSQKPFKVIGAFTDNQVADTADCPALTKALALVRQTGAELLIARLDRLSRKASFISEIVMDPAMRLRVASMPKADKFQLQTYAALAEQEQSFLLAQAKEALLAAEASSERPDMRRAACGRSNAIKKKIAQIQAQNVAGIVVPLRAQGATFQTIAKSLNAAGITTAEGKTWYPSQVQRVLKRLASCDDTNLAGDW